MRREFPISFSFQVVIEIILGVFSQFHFQRMGFRFRNNPECGLENPNIPALAKTAKIGHPLKNLLTRFPSGVTSHELPFIT
jgi:hypothetical protein